MKTSAEPSRVFKNFVQLVKQQNIQEIVDLLESQIELLLQRDIYAKTPLHYAAEFGHGNLIELFLNMFPDDHIELWINSPTLNGKTALMLAASYGNLDIVEALIRRGADTSSTAANGQTALEHAADAGYFTIVRVLQGTKISQKSTLLHEIKMKLDEEKRSESLNIRKNKPKVAANPMVGWTNLMIAAFHNIINEVKECLTQGNDDVEATTNDGRTALVLAASNGYHNVIDLLLTVGANINATFAKGWTALMAAVRATDEPTVKFLLKRGADVNHLSLDHCTALAEGTQQGQICIVKHLLECGADTEVRSSHDWPPLMHACYMGDLSMATLLLAHGAMIEATSLHDETPILLAAAGGHTAIIRTLLDAGCRPQSEWVDFTPNGHITGTGMPTVLSSNKIAEAQPKLKRANPLRWTPLMLACQNGHYDAAVLLLQAGANTEQESPMERTVLEIAQENGRSDIETLLREGFHN